MRFLAGLVFAAIVACGIDLQFVRQLPDFRRLVMLQYDHFLIQVARRTPPGASIAIYVPTPKFEPEYAYRYYRAVYRLQVTLLLGHAAQVVPYGGGRQRPGSQPLQDRKRAQVVLLRSVHVVAALGEVGQRRVPPRLRFGQ